MERPKKNHCPRDRIHVHFLYPVGTQKMDPFFSLAHKKFHTFETTTKTIFVCVCDVNASEMYATQIRVHSYMMHNIEMRKKVYSDCTFYQSIDQINILEQVLLCLTGLSAVDKEFWHDLPIWETACHTELLIPSLMPPLLLNTSKFDSSSLALPMKIDRWERSFVKNVFVRNMLMEVSDGRVRGYQSNANRYVKQAALTPMYRCWIPEQQQQQKQHHNSSPTKSWTIMWRDAEPRVRLRKAQKPK